MKYQMPSGGGVELRPRKDPITFIHRGSLVMIFGARDEPEMRKAAVTVADVFASQRDCLVIIDVENTMVQVMEKEWFVDWLVLGKP